MLPPPLTSPLPASTLQRYYAIRQFSERLCVPLELEDYGLQAMPDVSPPKWHLAHTTWFFETFLLEPHLPGYRLFHPQFGYLFNSYYETVGARHPRPQRGMISRPTVREIYQYRVHVDEAMVRLLEQRGDCPELSALIELGLHHEQQHQELLLMDTKFNFSVNPLLPAYQSAPVPPPREDLLEVNPYRVAAGLYEIGHGGKGFAFDNEGPRHQVFLQDYELDPYLVTNQAYLEFMQEGGYQRPELWLSEGWFILNQEGWSAPLYWHRQDQIWQVMTLMGLQRLHPQEPVCHLSYFEAEAFARWKGKRLPTEAEWEVVAQSQSLQGQFLDPSYPHPRQTGALYGSVWQWTQSPYSSYPGFQPVPGAVGEYNGKFMCNQFVLRGGCCVTPQGHIRSTYRNFFPPQARWQFGGLRLCRDAGSDPQV
ncbi:ergothioneine biosynthesis protein EgtB [Lyngbya confervoides]|uniref:Ergothioneine biosynthesis protein EgtB n=1 Tax=Lyngbya confervoides BDU141951 TaxID=1574623 RepID=A0ABD4T2V6_9CYAN|nr:ergothioneine biosynthesis protein EgtB [Lyngbya confervoides]MCM1982940.1 ergothioneine biosynthesis protein EgtB [Lyngbya confervoides BDU141951]